MQVVDVYSSLKSGHVLLSITFQHEARAKFSSAEIGRLIRFVNPVLQQSYSVAAAFASRLDNFPGLLRIFEYASLIPSTTAVEAAVVA